MDEALEFDRFGMNDAGADESAMDDAPPMIDQVKALALAYQDAFHRLAEHDAAANRIAARILADDDDWRMHAAASIDAATDLAVAKARIAALRPDGAGAVAVDELGVSFEFGTVRVTYPRNAPEIRLSADDARKLWRSDRGLALAIGVTETQGKPAAPTVTVRPLSELATKAAAKAAGIA